MFNANYYGNNAGNNNNNVQNTNDSQNFRNQNPDWYMNSMYSSVNSLSWQHQSNQNIFIAQASTANMTPATPTQIASTNVNNGFSYFNPAHPPPSAYRHNLLKQPPPPPIPPPKKTPMPPPPPPPPLPSHHHHQQSEQNDYQQINNNNENNINRRIGIATMYRSHGGGGGSGEMIRRNGVRYNPINSSGFTYHHDAKRNITVSKKSKRKPLSTHYSSKATNPADAIKALNLEKEINSSLKQKMLILKFPDPELNKDIVKGFSSFIENVHFQQPATPRYCFVTLKSDTDFDKVKKELSQITFGTGKVVVDYKTIVQPIIETSPEDIDPYTIYIGNLPPNVSVNRVKLHFPNANRIDIGYAQRMRYTRYAFIGYNSVDDSIAAFKGAFNMDLGARSLVIRFRRKHGNVGLNTGNGNNQKSTKKQQTDTTETDESMHGFDNDCQLDDHFSETFINDSVDLNEQNVQNQNENIETPIENIIRSEKQTPHEKSSSISLIEATATVANTKNKPNIVDSDHPPTSSDPPSSDQQRIKIEMFDNDENNDNNLLASQIKQEVNENYDEISEEEYGSGNDENCDAFNDDAFLRKNNLLPEDVDLELDGNHYWENSLVSRLQIKREENEYLNQMTNGNDKSKSNTLSAGNGSVSKINNNNENLDALFDGLNPDDGAYF